MRRRRNAAGFFREDLLSHPGMNEVKAISPAGKILVVDDNPIIQRAVYFALRDKGYQTLMVGEVSEATKIIRREKVDLVLVDLSFPMETATIGGPQQDGFYLINWINRTPEISKPPIVIISATDPAQYKDRASAAGIRACIQKPLNKETLLSIVQAILGEAKTSPPNRP
jgi:CheY-like chemotaxis protein